jgi:PBP1b-binding outer membrane lipoprotein LpoB
MKSLIAVAALALSLVGCASVNMGDAKQDAALKTFAVPKDKAGVYIYRNESMGAAIKMSVELDGKVIGQTAANTYLYKEVTPGKHTFTSKAENDSSIDVDAKPGTLLYIWQEVKMGFLGARSKLQLVDQAQGQKGVKETKLAETK